MNLGRDLKMNINPLDTLYTIFNFTSIYFFLLFPALLNAIATACFCDMSGCLFISVLILELIVFWLLPFFNGMIITSYII